MNKYKLTGHSIIQIILLLMAAIILFIVKSISIAFVIACIMLILDISYYTYVYRRIHKYNEKEQLATLRELRSELYYFVMPGLMAYLLVFHISGYTSPVEDLTVILVGCFLVISMIALVVCIIMIIKKNHEVR